MGRRVAPAVSGDPHQRRAARPPRCAVADSSRSPAAGGGLPFRRSCRYRSPWGCVANRRPHRGRDALAVGEDAVLAARTRAVDQAGTASGPLRAARTTWEGSITALGQSSRFADRSLFSSSWCSSRPRTRLKRWDARLRCERRHEPRGRGVAGRRGHGPSRPSSCGTPSRSPSRAGAGLSTRRPRRERRGWRRRCRVEIVQRSQGWRSPAWPVGQPFALSDSTSEHAGGRG